MSSPPHCDTIKLLALRNQILRPGGITLLINIAEILSGVGKLDYAVPAYNILNHLTLRAVLEECEAGASPVIIQTSVATVRFYGAKRLAAMVKAEAEDATVPVVLHLDHCTDPDLARHCVDVGWSSVMIDASRHPFDQNVAITRAIVEYAHARGVGVEGELGAISGVEDHIRVADDDAVMADVDQSILFCRETGVDAFAPAVGTAHGQYKGEPRLDFDRFGTIAQSCGVPLVVHGGTGLAPEAFRPFIALGATKINNSPARKGAYTGAIARFYAEHEKVAPLELDRFIIDSVRETVRAHNELFGSTGRA